MGWSTLNKVLLSSLLASFAVRGGLGLTKLVGRRVTNPLDTEDKKFDKLMTGKPQHQGYYNELAKQSADMHPAMFGTLALLAGVGGGAGGWKLADKLFDERRKTELQYEIDRKKKEYEKLLQGGTQIQLRLPKTAACIDRMAALHEGVEPEVVDQPEKKAEISLTKALPYLGYSALAALILGEAVSSYSSAREGSRIQRRLSAFKARPRKRVTPARAVFSQSKPTKRDAAGSATKLPKLTQTKLTSEEREEDPYRGT